MQAAYVEPMRLPSSTKELNLQTLKIGSWPDVRGVVKADANKSVAH